jgi:hypothetical protein
MSPAHCAFRALPRWGTASEASEQVPRWLRDLGSSGRLLDFAALRRRGRTRLRGGPAVAEG